MRMGMKRSFPVVAVLVLVVGAAWILRKRGETAPPTIPVPAVPRAAREPAATIPAPVEFPSSPAVPAPAPAKEESPLRVKTNVPASIVTLWVQPKGRDARSVVLESTANELGLAEIALGIPRTDVASIHATASARGWTTARGTSQGEDVELHLAPGFEVSGTVRFPDGRPAEGVRLSVKQGGHGDETDDAGRYAIGELPAGEVVIWSTDLDEERRVESGSRGVDFVMKRHVVRVRIRDEQGKFVPDVFFNMKVHSESGGGVWTQGTQKREEPLTIPAAPGSRLELAFRREGYANAVVKRTMGSDPDIQFIDVVLKRPGSPGRIALRVATDIDQPPKGARVTLQDETGMAVADLTRLEVPLEGGRGILDRVPEGSYRVHVSTGSRLDPEDFGLPVEQEMTVEAGKEISLDVVVKSGGRLAVVLKDAKGTIVPAGWLELVDSAGKRVDVYFGNRVEDGMSFSPDEADVAYGSAPVPPGSYELQVLRSLGSKKKVVARQEVVISWRKTAAVEITLPE